MSFDSTNNKTDNSTKFAEVPTCSSSTPPQINNSWNKKNWKVTAEKESFNNKVLINYTYPKILKNQRHSTGTIPKKTILKKIVKSMNTSKAKDEQTNLRFLFNISMDDFKKTVTVHEPLHLAIGNEVYSLPRTSKAVTEVPLVEMKMAKEQVEVIPQKCTDIDTRTVFFNEEATTAIAAALGNSINSSENFSQFDLRACTFPVKAKDSTTLINIIPNTGTSAPPVTPITSNHKLNNLSKDSKTKSPNGKVQPKNGFRVRQLELHKYRVEVEQKRLELLEMKLAKERDEILRERVLFEKDLEYKEIQLKQLRGDMTTI